jgi:hypothetical protein
MYLAKSLKVASYGCKEIDSAKFWQFTFPGRKNLEDQDVKIDLLTGPVPKVQRSKVKIRDQRVRPVQKPLCGH